MTTIQTQVRAQQGLLQSQLAASVQAPTSFLKTHNGPSEDGKSPVTPEARLLHEA